VISHAIVAPRTGRGRAVSGEAGRSADAAIEELYAAHWRSLVRLAVLLVRDVPTAEEVVQDSFVAVHARWDRLRDHSKALAYLRQSVVNGSRSVLRRRGTAARFAARQAGLPEAAVPSAEQQAEVGARRAVVLDAMARLPDRQREVLALRYYVDLSEAEIASTLGISAGAVKSHASRGTAALRATLGHLLEETP
jgi:RNA polymerase sigma-70 factor (sigma-E family)